MRKREGGLDKAYQPSGTYNERISAQASRADEAARAQREGVDTGPSDPSDPTGPPSSLGDDNDDVIMGEDGGDDLAPSDDSPAADDDTDSVVDESKLPFHLLQSLVSPHPTIDQLTMRQIGCRPMQLFANMK